jgi:Cu/Ag efflux protein CusF
MGRVALRHSDTRQPETVTMHRSLIAFAGVAALGVMGAASAATHPGPENPPMALLAPTAHAALSATDLRIAQSDEATKDDGMEQGHGEMKPEEMEDSHGHDDMGTEEGGHDASPAQAHGMGTVIIVKTDQNMVVVDHQDIPGFMGAMTMGFTVTDPSLLDHVAAGDMVRFTIETATGQIIDIEKAH